MYIVFNEGYTKKKNKMDTAGKMYNQGVILLVRMHAFLSGVNISNNFLYGLCFMESTAHIY